MEHQIIQIINAISPELWIMFFKLIIAFLIVWIIKDMISTFVNYLVFRTSKFISKNVEVNINGTDGFIEDYNMRAIFVRTVGGDLKIIPMNRWRFQDWTIKEHYTKIFGDKKE
jgi:hypothetical protein